MASSGVITQKKTGNSVYFIAMLIIVLLFGATVIVLSSSNTSSANSASNSLRSNTAVTSLAKSDSNNKSNNGNNNVSNNGGKVAINTDIYAEYRDEGTFLVNMTVSTSGGVGDVILAVHKNWAPVGVARFKELVDSSFYSQARFFRVIKGFMAQIGIHADPNVSKQWRNKNIVDDPVTNSNTRGTISFATAGKDTRTCQFFINLVNNKYLDKQGFTPFAEVVDGMNFVDLLYSGYGEGGKGDGSDGRGPSQGRLNQQGNAYLHQYFPKLSYVISMSII